MRYFSQSANRILHNTRCSFGFFNQCAKIRCQLSICIVKFTNLSLIANSYTSRTFTLILLNTSTVNYCYIFKTRHVHLFFQLLFSIFVLLFYCFVNSEKPSFWRSNGAMKFSKQKGTKANIIFGR